MQRVWSTYLDNRQAQQQRSIAAANLMNSSPRSSILSHANSAYSAAGSTRHILAEQSNESSSDYGGLLNPPSAPFARRSYDNLSVNSANASNLSLTVNYIPSKFSTSILTPGGARNRKGKSDLNLPKLGGGLDAFRSGEDRLGGKTLRWNKFKWILLFTNSALTLYSMISLVVCLLTWFDVWKHADVMRAGNRPELVVSTLAASFGIFTSVIGWAGLLLNNRGFMAWYTFLTWVTFALMLVPGYITYKRKTFNLEGKINAQWSRSLGADGRLRVQNQLECCGYFSPFIEATISQSCYARSILPGCKAPYLQFERSVLKRWYTAIFSLVPLHIAVMVAGLLCSNHITYRFGKGMMPEAYRLNMNTMAVIMENYANQLAEQYGVDIADEILKRSRIATFDSTSSLPSATSTFTHAPVNTLQGKYPSVSSSYDNSPTYGDNIHGSKGYTNNSKLSPYGNLTAGIDSSHQF